MSCETESTAIGEPVVHLKAKRSYNSEPVVFDWHDFLANQPLRSAQYALGAKVRLRRNHPRNSGLQYQCTTAGRTGSTEPRWPNTIDATVADGTAVWTAKSIDDNSLRTTVSSNDAPAVSGLTYGAIVVQDQRFTFLVSGGVDGKNYEIKHRIVCADGEQKEAIGDLPVRD